MGHAGDSSDDLDLTYSKETAMMRFSDMEFSIL